MGRQLESFGAYRRSPEVDGRLAVAAGLRRDLVLLHALVEAAERQGFQEAVS